MESCQHCPSKDMPRQSRCSYSVDGSSPLECREVYVDAQCKCNVSYRSPPTSSLSTSTSIENQGMPMWQLSEQRTNNATSSMMFLYRHSEQEFELEQVIQTRENDSIENQSRTRLWRWFSSIGSIIWIIGNQWSLYLIIVAQSFFYDAHYSFIAAISSAREDVRRHVQRLRSFRTHVFCFRFTALAFVSHSLVTVVRMRAGVGLDFD